MSTVNPHQYRSCTVKRRHADPAVALMVAQAQSRRFGEHIFAYTCSYCAGYHTGHAPWAVRRFVAELVKSEEFQKAQGLTIKPLFAVKVFEPARIH